MLAGACCDHTSAMTAYRGLHDWAGQQIRLDQLGSVLSNTSGRIQYRQRVLWQLSNSYWVVIIVSKDTNRNHTNNMRSTSILESRRSWKGQKLRLNSSALDNKTRVSWSNCHTTRIPRRLFSGTLVTLPPVLRCHNVRKSQLCALRIHGNDHGFVVRY
jgi:hypothetical protein